MKFNKKSIINFIIAMMLSLSIIQPSFVMAEEQGNTDSNEAVIESTVAPEVSEEPVNSSLPEESTLPESTENPTTSPTPESTSEPSEEIIEEADLTETAQPMLLNAQEPSQNNNVLIDVNISKAEVTITEGGLTKTIKVNNKKATALCLTTCVIEVSSQDATVKNVSLEVNGQNQELYNLGNSNDYTSRQVINVDNSNIQKITVNFGYKLTVTTHFLPTTGAVNDSNGWIKWSNSTMTMDKIRALEVCEPTVYTYVLYPGESFEATPQGTNDYPLNLLYLRGYILSTDLYSSYIVRKKIKGIAASNNPEDWISQALKATSADVTNQYIAVKAMPEKNSTVDYVYNYAKKDMNVSIIFEQVDGTYAQEDFVGPGLGALASYHNADYVADGKTQVNFDPNTNVFGDDINFPTNTSREDYSYLQAYLMSDTGYAGNVYYSGWNDATNEIGKNNMKAVTGLDLAADGSVSGTFINVQETRHYTIAYYYSLKRSLIYNSNDESNVNVNGGTTALNGTLAVRDNMFVRDGYTFVEWNENADGSGKAYKLDEIVTIGKVKEVVLYAQWKKNPTPEVTPTPTPNPTNPPVVNPTPTPEIEVITPPVVNPVNPGNPGNQQQLEEVVEEETPEVAPTATPTATPEVIEDDATPEVVGRSWALINLIASLIGMLLAIVLLFAKHDKEEEDEDDSEKTNEFERKRIYKVLGALLAIISIIVFLLTENITLPMKLVDKYTLLMIVFALGNGLCFFLGRKWYEVEEEVEQINE